MAEEWRGDPDYTLDRVSTYTRREMRREIELQQKLIIDLRAELAAANEDAGRLANFIENSPAVEHYSWVTLSVVAAHKARL